MVISALLAKVLITQLIQWLWFPTKPFRCTLENL